MRPVRVYLPLEASDLEALAGPAATVEAAAAYAVTQRLERAHPAADEEELEYAAFLAAVAQASADRGTGARRRVVAAADVDHGLVEDAGGAQPAAVRLTGPVPLRVVVSLHVDERPGGHDELLWYDITELDAVRDLVG